jgi:hypothetical protein
VGKALTVNDFVTVLVHVFAAVTVTVYVPAVDTVLVAPLPKPFDHVYVEPPEAIHEVDDPAHIALDPVMTPTGKAFTVN